ncbi:MAG: PIG-L family deacetylase [Anaerolineales bacterium]|nr:PIG-L family deacetylase [Anaerolineales bacterium]
MSDRRLLSVFAHPDDETFGAGGTLALYARRGVEVHLACATRGEAGEAPPGLRGFASTGEMREYELRCAAEILGLAGVHLLDYRDSGMEGSPDNAHPRALAAAPVAEVARPIVGLIRRLRPQVVITFDPIGGYKHPDHIAAHRAAVEAFRLAPDPGAYPDEGAPYSPQKLYFHTFPHGFIRMAARILALLGQDPGHFGKNRDIDLVSLAGVDFPIHAKINFGPVIGVKQKASACHSSQGGGGVPGIALGLMRLMGSSEDYMRAHPLPPPKRIERDLFEGVDDGR